MLIVIPCYAVLCYTICVYTMYKVKDAWPYPQDDTKPFGSYVLVSHSTLSKAKAILPIVSVLHLGTLLAISSLRRW